MLVENRLLTGSVTLDAGRHILPSNRPADLGNLTIGGGDQTDSEATRIEIHQGGFAQFGNGLLLTSGSGFTFDGADQTHVLQVGYNGPAGTYSIQNFKLPTANHYTDASKQVRNELGGSWQIEAEYGNVFGGQRTFRSPTTDRASVV